MELHTYQRFFLVGIKGVAMTSLAQLLLDANKTVLGSDVADDFVTAAILRTLPIAITVGFDQAIPADTECVIYTAAHNGKFNPQVQEAAARGIPTFSHAEALGAFFNQKKGIAVCGVGGKSTTSAMITWIFAHTNRPISFSVGVGSIIGMKRTGAWDSTSEYCVAEADEYVIDPSAPSRGEEITPRFSFMQPHITVCTKIRFDHPDVYRDLAHTQHVYQTFFSQIKPGGTLILNVKDVDLVPPSAQCTVCTVGTESSATLQYGYVTTETGVDGYMTLKSQDNKRYSLRLPIPGVHNLENAAFAVATALQCGIPVEESNAALATFRSTQRRFEDRGIHAGVQYFDDYAHHPAEVRAAIAALNQWYPNARKVVAFQSHTFSRTKQLFDEFVAALATASEIVLIDIFASARETYDASITSDMLVRAVQEKHPSVQIRNVHTIAALAHYLQTELREGTVCLTLGAGDIYKVHEYINPS